MDLAALLVVLGMAILTVAYVGRPLIEGSHREPGARERRLSSLRAEYDQALSLLHELEMDFAMGKIEEADYLEQRATRLARGAAVLREIDELAAAAAQAGESLVPPSAPADGDLEARVAQLRERAGGFCGRCGQLLLLGDRFCSRCGHPVPGPGT